MISCRFVSFFRVALALGLSLHATLPALSETTNPAPAFELTVTTDRPEAIYHQGDKVIFNIHLRHKSELVSAGEVNWKISKDGFPPVTKGRVILTNGSASITGKLDEPGFLQCSVSFAAPDQQNVTALAGAAVDPLQIKPSLPVPDDFDAFWAEQKKKLAAVPVNPRLTPVKSPKENVECFDLQADSIGAPVSGYFARPASAKPKSLPIILTVHGAGVASSSLGGAAGWASRGYLALDLNAHGIPNGRPEEFYADLWKGELKEYIFRGRESRETFYFLGVFLRLVRAVDFLTAQPEWDGRIVIVHGSSQGGAQALVAAGLDPRVTFFAAGVPAMCDHTGTAVGRANGWPKLVPKGTNGQPDPKVTQVARYYDAMNFVTRTHAAGIVTVGFIDGVCPPTSVYAAYNAIKGSKQIFNDPPSGHNVFKPASEAMRKAIADHVAASSAAGTSTSRLIVNGGFERVEEDNHQPKGWASKGSQIAADPPAGAVAAEPTQTACTLSSEQPHSGKYCAMISRNAAADADHFLWAQKDIPLEGGRLYRLRFWARADKVGADMAAVCFNSSGPEGPAWPLKPLRFDRPDIWQKFEMLLRAQVGFNSLNKTDLEFRLYQWNPNAPGDKTPEHLWIDDVSFEPMPTGKRTVARIVRWLIVPSQPQLRYADLDLSLGDGVIAEESGLELYRDGTRLERAGSIEQVKRAGQFAFSGRSRRVYVVKGAAGGNYEFRFRPSVNTDGGAFLNMPPPDGSRALHGGAKEREQIALEISEPGGVDRKDWPVTQGLPLPRGTVADASQIRVLDAAGIEVPAQVRATSYWEDDSVRWVMLDFNTSVATGQKAKYFVECGNSIRRAEVKEPIQLQQDAGEITVDTGAMKFSISTNHFRLFENVEVGGIKALSAPTAIKLEQDTGKLFTTDRIKPYAVVVEESGPLHAVIAVMGWNANEEGERLCTYTTRIHAYRGQKFVRVFHTLVNRHEQNVMGKHKVASEGFPKDTNLLKTIELPQQNIADATISVPLSGVTQYELATTTSTPLSGAIGDGVIHRQDQRTSGVLKRGNASQAPDTSQATDALPGWVTVRGDKIALTAAIYNYTNLFPKELRVKGDGVELGLIPFSRDNPHGILKGTARTSEILLAFTPADSKEGEALARAFAQPVVFSNPELYCSSEGFMNDALIPANDKTVGTYDRIMSTCVKGLKTPLGPELDDCGLINYGDFPYLSYNRWVNLEYDVDLGLYLHFARTGDRSAYLFGQDCSRHFLDSDTGWFTGDFETHGVNYRHNFVHYDPKPPSGHTYTVGLMHYYLLTGDRRGLEAARYVADACFRVCYYSTKVKGSAYGATDTVAVPRLQFINNRAFSDPARYALHTYQALGEPKYLEATLAIADQLARFNKSWLGHDDMYFHYRWPPVLEDLVKITDSEDAKKLLKECADWTLRVPYSRFGEYRGAQSYSGYPASDNNARMMFQTIYAGGLTGRREYVDWFLNMYDREVEKSRKIEMKDPTGKGFGKFSDNPARALADLVPYRTVLVDVGPPRFELTPPGKGEWKIAVGNTSETGVDCTVKIGPLPKGVKMETGRKFALGVKEEKEFTFPVEFTDALAEGRTTIPYSVYTTGTDGRKGERHGFFAVHALRPVKQEPAKLVFHAPMDNEPTASAPGKYKALIEKADFIDGKVGKAMGPRSVAASFDVLGKIRPEAGTFALWVRLPDAKKNLEIVRLAGHGYWFLALGSKNFIFDAQEHPFGAVAPTVDRWHHLAIAWDLQKAAFYVDGKPLVINNRSDKTQAAPGSINRTHFDIPAGRLQLMTEEAVAFDDVRIYSQPLTAGEIQGLCKDLKFGQPPPEKLPPAIKRSQDDGGGG